MARELTVNVVLADPKTGEPAVFAAGTSDLPAWAVKQIGDHCFGDEPTPARGRRAARGKAAAAVKDAAGDGGDQGESQE